MEEQIKEWLESYRPVRQRTVRVETPKKKVGPCHQQSTLVNPKATNVKRDFGPLKKTGYHQRIRYHNALLAFNSVDDRDVTEVIEDQRQEPIHEYETD